LQISALPSKFSETASLFHNLIFFINFYTYLNSSINIFILNVYTVGLHPYSFSLYFLPSHNDQWDHLKYRISVTPKCCLLSSNKRKWVSGNQWCRSPVRQFLSVITYIWRCGNIVLSARGFNSVGLVERSPWTQEFNRRENECCIWAKPIFCAQKILNNWGKLKAIQWSV
jgi:hypothetical protein